jgi:hypothetical protein
VSGPGLRIWHKLVIICAAFTIPLALTTYFLLEEKRIKIDFAQQELYGDEYLRPLSRLLDDVAAHRTLVAMGDTASPRLAAVEQRIEDEMSELLRIDRRLGRSLKTASVETDSAALRGGAAGLAAQWRLVRAPGLDPSASEAGHHLLIGDLRTLVAHVGDTSKLILDPDLDTYYIMDALLIREPEIVDRLHAFGDRVRRFLMDSTADETSRRSLTGDL